MSRSVLDELVFQAVPLGEPLPKWPPTLAVQINSLSASLSANATGAMQAATASLTSPALTGTKPYTQAAPLFARDTPMASSDLNWPAYCGLLKDSGIPMQARFSELESLSDVNVPQRIVSRGFDEGFELNDLVSADMVLIDCSVTMSGNRCPRLPLETAGWHELKQMVESLRQVVGSGTPIGLGLLAGDVYTDVSNALAARVDFVVLEFVERSIPAEAAANHLAWSVVAARNACAQTGMPAFPIFVDATLTNIDHMVKLLALGASALSIDALMANALPSAAPVNSQIPKGLLSGIGSLPVKVAPNVQPLAARLEELLGRIRARVFQQQLASLAALNRDHLRALSDQSARLCAVKMLEH